MDAIEALLTRRTVPQVKMTGPGPDEAALRTILEAGAAAPDHGKLRPWRFLVVQGEARGRLGQLFADSAARLEPNAEPEALAKLRELPLRVPIVIVVVASVRSDHPKIPAVEQIASAAAAAQNMLVATHAQGFAAKWSTGKPAYNPHVAEGLGLRPGEQIIAILYVGSSGIDHAVPERPRIEAIAQPWNGDAR